MCISIRKLLGVLYCLTNLHSEYFLFKVYILQ